MITREISSKVIRTIWHLKIRVDGQYTVSVETILKDLKDVPTSAKVIESYHDDDGHLHLKFEDEETL